MFNKRLLFCIISLALIKSVLFPGRLFAAENFDLWTYNSNITLNTTLTGANIASKITDFPVLIRLSSSNFIFSEARGTGQDIRFRKSNGIPLSYQIERWDSTGGTAEIWVKIDTLEGNTDGQVVNMLWGNPSAEDSSNGKAVFDSANGFAGVWHLNEVGSTISRNYKDATAMSSHGTGIGMDANSSVLGMIGSAQKFDGNFSSIALPPLQSQKAKIISISAWVLADSYSLPTGDSIFYHSLWSNNNGLPGDYRFQFTQNKLSVGINGASPENQIASPAIVPETWNYFCSVYNSFSKKIRFYINGTLVDTKAYTTAGEINLADSSHIGTLKTWYQFKGIMDELVISNTNRTEDWVKLAYANQKANQSLVTLKPPQRCTASFLTQKDTTVNEGAYLTLNAKANCASQITWSIVSGPAPRILDPEATQLPINIPRINQETFIVYKVVATFRDSTPTRTIRIQIKDVTPDPIFTMPNLGVWNGKNPLEYRPIISNLAAIQSSSEPIIHRVWSFSGVDVDTISSSEGILLSNPTEGTLEINLCLDNGGSPNCKSSIITVAIPSALKSSMRAETKTKDFIFYDLRGRHQIPRVGVIYPYLPAKL